MIDLTNSNPQTEDYPVEAPAEIPEVKKNLWSIDKFDEDGQIRAGVVDREQEEFLKKTEWTK